MRAASLHAFVFVAVGACAPSPSTEPHHVQSPSQPPPSPPAPSATTIDVAPGIGARVLDIPIVGGGPRPDCSALARAPDPCHFLALEAAHLAAGGEPCGFFDNVETLVPGNEMQCTESMNDGVLLCRGWRKSGSSLACKFPNEPVGGLSADATAVQQLLERCTAQKPLAPFHDEKGRHEMGIAAWRPLDRGRMLISEFCQFDDLYPVPDNEVFQPRTTHGFEMFLVTPGADPRQPPSQ